MMNILSFWGKASEASISNSTHHCRPFVKGASALIPEFMESVAMSDEEYIAGMQAREDAYQSKLKQQGKQDDPSRKVPNMLPLSYGQKRHSVRFFQTFIEAKTCFETFNDVKDVFIQHGRLALTYKLKQLCRMRVNAPGKDGIVRSVPVNVVFHNFDGKEWGALKDYNANSEFTIHVFHSAVSEEMMADRHAIEIECYRPNVFFNLPGYFDSMLKLSMDDTNARANMKRLLLLYPVIVALNFLRKHGGGRIVVDEMHNFGEQMIDIFHSEFPDMERVDFPSKRLHVTDVKSISVVERVEMPSTVAEPRMPKAKVKGAKSPNRVPKEPLEDILVEVPKKAAATKKPKSKPETVSSDKLEQLSRKFKGEDVTA